MIQEVKSEAIGPKTNSTYSTYRTIESRNNSSHDNNSCHENNESQEQ